MPAGGVAYGHEVRRMGLESPAIEGESPVFG